MRVCCVVFFFKQKTAYEMRISDWSSDVCSSDLKAGALGFSTTRTMVHRTADGDLTPTVGAADAEMRAIALGLKDAGAGEIGRASCRERVCQYVSISVVAGSLQKKN